MKRLSKDWIWMIGLTGLSAFIIWLFRDHVDDWIGLLTHFSGSPWAVFVATAVFVVGSFFLIPQWALIATAIAAFGLVEGVGIAWLATMVSTSVHYGLGRAFETRVRQRLSGKRLESFKVVLTENSVWSGMIVRIIPTGPAIFVNATAGLLRLNAGGFLLGTAIGIVPKILLTAIIVSELISSAQGGQITIGLVVMAVLILAALVIRARRRRKAAPETSETAE